MDSITDICYDLQPSKADRNIIPFKESEDKYANIKR